VRVEIAAGELEQARADLQQAAEALSHIHPMNSRRPIREMSYQKAAMAAMGAGVPLPPAGALSGPWGPGWNRYQRGNR